MRSESLPAFRLQFFTKTVHNSSPYTFSHLIGLNLTIGQNASWDSSSQPITSTVSCGCRHFLCATTPLLYLVLCGSFLDVRFSSTSTCLDELHHFLSIENPCYLTHPPSNSILRVSPGQYRLALLAKVRKRLSRQPKSLQGISWRPQLRQRLMWKDVIIIPAIHRLIYQHNSLLLLYGIDSNGFTQQPVALLNSLILGFL